MDKRVLQNYASWAKGALEGQIEVSLKVLGIGSAKDIKKASVMGDYTVIEGDERSYSKDLYKKRESIINLIKEDGYSQTIETFAYTWFNRLIALRFMEVHGYMPHGFRVLSSQDVGQVEPEILRNLHFVKDELKLDLERCNNLRSAGDIEALFRYVLFRQCNALSDILPMLFASEGDYLELLLPQTLLRGTTVLTELLAIGEEPFLEDVEVIGWLYQFYVSGNREEFRKARLVNKSLIPTLTQVFTPEWIVKYMAENSVGRMWLESYPISTIKEQMKYYVEDATQEPAVQRKIDAIKYNNLNPKDIKVIEPCCGSGHILVYVFDLLVAMYEEQGYQKREIPALILSNNLYGLDIDKRASQLASFSLIMKARSINPRFFNKGSFVLPKVYEIRDSRYVYNMGYKKHLQDLGNVSAKVVSEIEYVVDTFMDAKTIGSLLKVKSLDYDRLLKDIEQIQNKSISNIFNNKFLTSGLDYLKKLIELAKILADKYDVMITNPPYLGISKFEKTPKEYLTANYPDSKADMFAMFMEAPYVKTNGFRAMVNPDSWMFLVSFEKLRKKIISRESIINMAHLGMGAFDAVVQTTTFVIRNSSYGGNGVYFRLVDSKDKEQDFVDNLKSRGGGVHNLS